MLLLKTKSNFQEILSGLFIPLVILPALRSSPPTPLRRIIRQCSFTENSYRYRKARGCRAVSNPSFVGADYLGTSPNWRWFYSSEYLIPTLCRNFRSLGVSVMGVSVIESAFDLGVFAGS